MATLENGYWVALALLKPIAGQRCYVGEIQETDEAGIRITMVDWINGRATDFDFYVRWDLVEAALVATPEHHIENFGPEAEAFQRRHNGKE